MRGAVAARFFTLRVLTDNTFPPLIRLSGQSPNQEVKAGPLAKSARSGPTSAKRVCVLKTPIRGTWVRSTPKIAWK
jgi:hypothetical protein